MKTMRVQVRLLKPGKLYSNALQHPELPRVPGTTYRESLRYLLANAIAAAPVALKEEAKRGLKL